MEPKSKQVAKQDARRFRHLSSPEHYKLIEILVWEIRNHVRQKVTPRLFPDDSCSGVLQPQLPNHERRQIPPPDFFAEFVTAFLNACGELSILGSGRTTASFEQAFRLIEPMLRHDHFTITGAIMVVLTDPESRKHPHVGQMLLKYIAAMASIIYSPTHPHSVWPKSLYQLCDGNPPETMDIYLTVMRARTEGVQSILGPDDPYSIITNNYIDEAILKQGQKSSQQILKTFEKYQTMIDDRIPPSKRFRYHMNARKDYGQLLYRSQDYGAALSLLEDVPSHLDEHIKAWEAGRQTVSNSENLIVCTTLLGEVFAGLGDHKAAQQTLIKAYNASLYVYGPDHSQTINIVAVLGKYFDKLNLNMEANAWYALLDEGLKPYMFDEAEVPAHMGLARVENLGSKQSENSIAFVQKEVQPRGVPILTRIKR